MAQRGLRHRRQCVGAAFRETVLVCRRYRGNVIRRVGDCCVVILRGVLCLYRGLRRLQHDGAFFGRKPRAHSDLDICILGDLELVEAVKALGSVQQSLQREINPVVMSTSRFIDQLAKHDRFAVRIFAELKLYVIGDDDEFAKLINATGT